MELNAQKMKKWLIFMLAVSAVATADLTPELSTSIDPELESNARSGKIFYITTTTTLFKYTEIYTQFVASFR